MKSFLTKLARTIDFFPYISFICSISGLILQYPNYDYNRTSMWVKHMPANDLRNKVTIRDWSLIMGRGDYKTGGGEFFVKFYPYEKGDRQSFSYAEWGGGTSFGVVFKR